MSFNNLPNETRYGIHSIDHFALEIPSLSEGKDFFKNFGLNVSDEDNALALKAYGIDHVWARLFRGPTKKLAYLSLSCYPEELDQILKQAVAAGAKKAPYDAKYVSKNGHWLYDPDGNLFQIKVAQKVTPYGLTAKQNSHQLPNERGVGTRSQVKQVHPSRLSHILMFTPNIEQAICFWSKGLGLRVSDRGGEKIVFMHGRHGSDHHLVAFALSHAKGWHHSAWNVDGIDDVGLGAEQMRNADYTEGWGTGRHVLGSNFFNYIRDPWGSFAEYSADIDFIPTGSIWPSANHRAEDAMYLWGPDVPDYFIQNSEQLK